MHPSCVYCARTPSPSRLPATDLPKTPRPLPRPQLRVQRCAFTAWLEVCRARQTTRWCVETAARGRERRMARSALLSWSALAEDLSRARARADEMRRERDAAALAEAWEGWRGVARGDHIDIDTSSDEAEPGWEGDDDGRGDSSAAESGEEANADASADAGREAKESERTRRVAAHVHALPRRALLRSLCRPASVRFLLASITAAWRLQAAQSRSLRLARETMHTRSPSVEPSSALAKRAQEFQRQGSRVTRSGKYAEAIDAGAVAGQAGGKGARGGGGGAGGGESRPASAGGGAASADRVAKLRREVERVRVEKDHLVALLQALQSSSAQRVAQQQDAIDKRGERIAAMFAAQRGAMKRAQCFRGWAAVAGVGAGAGAGAGDGGAAWRSARRAHRTDDTASSQGGDKPASVAGARAASGAAPHAPHSSSHANTHHANAHAHKPGSAKKSPLGMGGVTGAGYADAGAQHEAWGAGSGAGAGLVAGGGEERWGSPQRQQVSGWDVMVWLRFQWKASISMSGRPKHVSRAVLHRRRTAKALPRHRAPLHLPMRWLGLRTTPTGQVSGMQGQQAQGPPPRAHRRGAHALCM